MTGFWHRVLAGLLLGQVPILKRGSLHGMPGDLCDCIFNGLMTQLFEDESIFLLFALSSQLTQQKLKFIFQIKQGCVWPESHCLC
jgi:hypothetical protein